MFIFFFLSFLSSAQCAGLGNLRHNTILLTYPEDWRQTHGTDNARVLQFTCKSAPTPPSPILINAVRKIDITTATIYIGAVTVGEGIISSFHEFLPKKQMSAFCGNFKTDL